MQVEISVAGDKEVSLEIRRWGQRASDATPLWENIAGMLRRLAREQYASVGERGPSGRWDRLQPATLQRKAARNQDLRILRASGDMFKSLTRKNAPGSVFHPTRDSMVWGSSIDYFKYHQSRRERTSNLPRRAVIDPTLQDKLDIGKRVQKWLRAGELRGETA